MSTIEQTRSEDLTTKIDRYVALSIRHGQATESGNYEDANSAYKEIEIIFDQLLQSGNRSALVPLLSHENASVRAKAAFHTYVLDSHRAEVVLEGVAASSSLVGFSAGMTLKQLRSGGLTAK